LAPSTPGATSSQVYNDFGRGFLRWWDPADLSRISIDNDEAGAAGVPLANWNQPLPTTLVRASFAVIGTGPAYRYATTGVSLRHHAGRDEQHRPHRRGDLDLYLELHRPHRRPRV